MSDEKNADPVCDRCKTPLVIHRDTLAGQGCDLGLVLSDLWRALLVAALGQRRGWRVWRVLNAPKLGPTKGDDDE